MQNHVELWLISYLINLLDLEAGDYLELQLDQILKQMISSQLIFSKKKLKRLNQNKTNLDATDQDIQSKLKSGRSKSVMNYSSSKIRHNNYLSLLYFRDYNSQMLLRRKKTWSNDKQVRLMNLQLLKNFSQIKLFIFL